MAIRFYEKTAAYGEFSNFSDHGVEFDGKLYPTVEHYFQAMKFQDRAYAEKIRLAANPMNAKRLGQTRKVPIRADWEGAKLDVMRDAVRQKFSMNPELKELLLGTNNEEIEEIIEASPSDCFWGCGESGNGKNWLGKILMEIRQEFRDASP